MRVRRTDPVCLPDIKHHLIRATVRHADVAPMSTALSHSHGPADVMAAHVHSHLGVACHFFFAFSAPACPVAIACCCCSGVMDAHFTLACSAVTFH